MGARWTLRPQRSMHRAARQNRDEVGAVLRTAMNVVVEPRGGHLDLTTRLRGVLARQGILERLDAKRARTRASHRDANTLRGLRNEYSHEREARRRLRELDVGGPAGNREFHGSDEF